MTTHNRRGYMWRWRTLRHFRTGGTLNKAAKELKEWRRRSSLAQREVAIRIGVQTQAISNLECGRAVPSLRHAVMLEALTGIPPRAWFTLDEADAAREAA